MTQNQILNKIILELKKIEDPNNNDQTINFFIKVHESVKNADRKDLEDLLLLYLTKDIYNKVFIPNKEYQSIINDKLN